MMNIRTLGLSMAAMLFPACASTPEPASPLASTVVSASAPSSSEPVPEAAPVPARGPSAAAPIVVACKASSGRATFDVRFDLDSMRGSVAIDGLEKRRFAVHAVPHAGTYVLMFSGYGAGDDKRAGEALVADKSIVTRVVADVDDQDLYFDGAVRPAGIGSSLRCAR